MIMCEHCSFRVLLAVGAAVEVAVGVGMVAAAGEVGEQFAFIQSLLSTYSKRVSVAIASQGNWWNPL